LFFTLNKPSQADVPTVELFSEYFDGVTAPDLGDKFTPEGENNFWGTFDGNGTNYLWSDYLNIPYLADSNSSLVSSPTDLSAKTANLTFNISCDTELRTSEWKDYVIISGFDGTDWNEIARYDETSLGDEDFHNQEIDLSSFSNSDFKFKLTWITDSANNDHLGCAFWPIRIVETYLPPEITLEPDQDGTETLDNSITVSYTVDGVAKTKTFSNLVVGGNELEISEANLDDPSKTSTATLYVTYKEPLNLNSSNFTSGWNMVSFPDGSGVTDRSLLPNTFKVRKYEPVINNYERSEDGEISLSPGEGFWIKVDDVSKITGLRYPLAATNTVGVSASKGWNFLGNPFQSDLQVSSLSVEYKDGSTIAFSEAVSRKDVAGYLWTYEIDKQYYLAAINPLKYKTSAPTKTFISPFRGFWMIVKSDQVNRIIMNK